MQEEPNNRTYKITELEQEMKSLGMWQHESPDWVTSFEESSIMSELDFAKWLQYVFVPNHVQYSATTSPVKQNKLIVPQALKYFGTDVRKGKLLQILIEIDSLL